MKVRIKSVLSPLVGKPLTDMWAYGCWKFEFGPQVPFINRKGQESSHADWRFVIECSWELAKDRGWSISSAQLEYVDGRLPDEARDLVRPLREELASAAPVLQSIEATDEGEVLFRLQQGYTLRVVPDRLVSDERAEQWRYMPSGDASHFVLDATP